MLVHSDDNEREVILLAASAKDLYEGSSWLTFWLLFSQMEAYEDLASHSGLWEICKFLVGIDPGIKLERDLSKEQRFHIQYADENIQWITALFHMRTMIDKV